MSTIKTAQEILSEAHGILPQYLNVHCGKITSERNVEAMKAYARQALEAYRDECLKKAKPKRSRIEPSYQTYMVSHDDHFYSVDEESILLINIEDYLK